MRLKVIGAGHSFSAVAAPDDVAVSMDRHSGIVAEGEGTVTVRAGTRLHALNAALAERRLALPILGSIAQQSVAGAIATGTHGSSLAHGNLASLAIGVRLVDGAGDGHDVADDLLDGVRVHLGALGVLTEVTLQVEPAFRLAQTIEQVPVRDVGSQLEQLSRSAEYVKVWWVPHTPDAQVIRYDRTDEPAGRAARIERFVDQRIVHPAVLPGLFALQERRPGLVGRLNPVVARTLVKGRRVGPSTLMFSTPHPARHDETEAAVPLARGGEAWGALVVVVESGIRVNFIAELAVRPWRPGMAETGVRRRRRAAGRLHGPGARPRRLLRWLLARAADPRGASALGQGARPHRGRAGAALPAVGRVRGAPRPARPAAGVRQPVSRARARGLTRRVSRS